MTTGETEHEGAGHGDVTLSLTTEQPDGTHLHRSWTICECSLLLQRLGPLLGEPEHETIATPEATRATAAAVRGIPGAIHTGGGL